MAVNHAELPMTIILENSPPRPVSGDGEVAFRSHGRDLVITWESGKAVDVSAAEGSPAFYGLALDVGDEIACYKCWFSGSNGVMVCLPISC